MHYRQLLSAIAQAHTSAVGRAAAAVNQGLVLRNWLVGAYVVEFEQGGEDRAKYGDGLMPRLAKDLIKRKLPGLGLSTLKNCRLFYQTYPQISQSPIGFSPIEAKSQSVIGFLTGPGVSASPVRKSTTRQPVVGELPETLSAPTLEIRSSPMTKPTVPKKSSSLMGKSAPDLPTPLTPQQILQFSWTQLIELLRLDDPWKRAFYENECLLGGWSVRQLQRQIGSQLYERTGLSKNKRAVVARARKQSADSPATIEDLIRDPYVLEFAGLSDRAAYSENDLESALLNHVQAFLLELGTGFCFEARQFRITVGNEHDRVDLVFYHRRLRCHVLLDLKIRAFGHGDAGQMNFYLNYFKQHMMAPGDQPPVGILLCSDKDETKVEYATAGLSQKLFVSRYLVALPSVAQLKRFVEADRARMAR
jgi:predicted nuclease of restriction endonuclease-like (RecB) superfamily